MKKNMKKLISMALAATMALSLMVPAWAAESRGPIPVTVSRIENVKAGSIEARGDWVDTGHYYDASDGIAGGRELTFSYSYTVTGSSNITVGDDVLQASFGVTIGESVTLTSTCNITVNAGQKGKIMARGTYQKYTADQVLYRISTGSPQQELKRESITVYVPYGMEFKGVAY